MYSMNPVIIADASCLIILTNIGRLKILKHLFGRIIITKEVADEYGEALPHWISVKTPANQAKVSELIIRLDKGEATSIALAIELQNSRLIIDETKGRKVAKFESIKIIGTIGVLIMAKKYGFVDDINKVIQDLIANGFRISESLIEEMKHY